MDRIKLFAIKTDKVSFEFINFILPKGALFDDDDLLESLFKKICKILLPYLNVLSEEYVVIAYLNKISNGLEMDIDQAINIKLSNAEREELNKIISAICKVFVEVLAK